MTCYYNDSEPFVCAWLRNLIAAGLLPAGDVDERPIQEVMPDDVRRYTQAHFFAGIGGWAYALQLAGWGDRPVWTGSCPCQPLSGAGLGLAHADQRHVWPAFYRLIEECRPPVVFGEQVAKKLGLEWFAGVRADLEAARYACGAVDLCAASVGAPHIRQRLFWVADANSAGWQDAARWTGQAGPPGRLLIAAQAPEAGLREWAPQPATGWVVDGLPYVPHAVRGYGNAVVPQVAAAFVSAYMECAPRGTEL